MIMIHFISESEGSNSYPSCLRDFADLIPLSRVSGLHIEIDSCQYGTSGRTRKKFVPQLENTSQGLAEMEVPEDQKISYFRFFVGLYLRIDEFLIISFQWQQNTSESR